jgi:hypothetical protein
MQIGQGIRITGGVIISPRAPIVTLPDPGGAGPITNKLAGLSRRSYLGYFAERVDFFDTAPLRLRGISNPYIELSGFDTGDAFSVQWLGYFKPPTTDEYTLYTSSDDASYVWIGSNAISGYNLSNALIKNGGVHTSTEKFGKVYLTAGADQYYPIRIQYGDFNGAQTMSLSYSTPTITKTNSFSGLIYYNQDTGGI